MNSVMVFTLGLRHTLTLWQRPMALVQSLQFSHRSLRSGRCRKNLPLGDQDHMELNPLNIREDVSVDHAYFQTQLPSPPNLDILVVRFTGQSGFGCANNSDAIYMEAMIRAGITAFDPVGVLLDLRNMAYEWGDMMVNPLCAGHQHYVDSDLPLAVVVSDLNREGLTSLVTDEMQSDPSKLLFETMETAIHFLDGAASGGDLKL